jgi:serine protease Do
MSGQPNKRVRGGKRLFGFLMVLFVLGLGIGIGTIISHRADATGPGDSQLQIQTDGKPLAGGAFLALSQAFEEVSKRVGPAVVNINTEEVITRGRSTSGQGQGQGQGQEPDDLGDFFRRFGFGTPQQMPEQQKVRSLGSGVIVDPKGYIITNNHVVEGATRIQVSMSGGEEYTAKLVGTDAIADIAVIKITGSKDFPFVRVGDSKKMKVGDWVIAIGSPFGLDQTVTAGIISATGRTFKQEEAPSPGIMFNDYLQTDASINRGNSGGPLVNMNAEVVGINSFISTTSGSSAGVGFSVPSHLFAKVYNQILQTGKYSRGWLGVSFNPLPFTPAMANFFGVKQGSGVLVTKLSDEKGGSSETGPAAKAGIRPEDVIVEYDGKKILAVQDFRMAVADTPPGHKVKVRVIRHGEEKIFEVTVGERLFEEQQKVSNHLGEEKPKTEIGLVFDEVPVRVAKSVEISSGAFVTSVKPGSLADDAGLEGADQGIGDVIVGANGKQIASPQELLKTVKALKHGEPLILKFLHFEPVSNTQFETYTYYTSIVIP